MRQHVWLAGAMVLLAAACGPSANVELERNTLLQRDREWSQTPKDVEKFLSYFAPDASAYPPGMPIATGTERSGLAARDGGCQRGHLGRCPAESAARLKDGACVGRPDTSAAICCSCSAARGL